MNYQDSIDAQNKRRKKQLQDYKIVAKHILKYVKSNSSISLDDVVSSLKVFKGNDFEFECPRVILGLMADGYICFNEDRSKVLFLRDLVWMMFYLMAICTKNFTFFYFSF